MIAFAFHFTVENLGVSFCFVFLPQMSYVLCEMRDDPYLCSVSLLLYQNLCTLRYLNFAVTALFRDCSEDIC
jgi:hypothetical protein